MNFDPRVAQQMLRLSGEATGASFVQALGHGRTDENRQVLDNGELNLGRNDIVPFRVGNTNLVPGYGTPVRMLELRGDSKLARFITITFNILPIDTTTLVLAALRNFGPLIGIIEFGNGSAFSQVEVDLQPGGSISTIIGGGGLVNAFSEPFGGTMVSVPASSIRVFVRNDGGYQPLGDGSQIGNITNIPNVMAHAAYGQKPSSEPNTRTMWVTGRSAQGAAFFNAVAVPPFARSVYIYRSNIANTQLSVNIEDFFGTTIDGPIVIPAGTDGSSVPIKLSGIARSVRVTNLGPGASEISAVFNIQI